MEDLFLYYLKLSNELRPEYISSLGLPAGEWRKRLLNVFHKIPPLAEVIYSSCSGTMRNINRQELMDFIPGFRQIHINELQAEAENVDNIMEGIKQIEDEFIESVFPVLSNYSSDYICLIKMNTGKEWIVEILHDDECIVLHRSPFDFLQTLCRFYEEKVYFLDSDGYLDYDFEREGIVGMKLNPEVKYWQE